MSILGGLKDTIGLLLRVALFGRNPVLKAAGLRSLETWGALGLDHAFNKETGRALGEQQFALLQSIVRDQNPVMKCRQALCDAVIELSEPRFLTGRR